MAKSILPFLLLFISLSIPAQISEGEYTKLRKALSQKINQLRISKKLDPLGSDLILRKAAKNHSEYMAKQSKLSHNQNKYEMANPTRRVKFFNGDDFEIVGELSLIHI